MLQAAEIEKLDLGILPSFNPFLTEINKLKILTLFNKAEWSAYLNRLPVPMQDIYYTPEYYEIYEKNGDGKAICLVFEKGNDFALYPFLLNRINDLGYQLDDSFYDIQGAYGYNGVLSSSNDPEFIISFHNEFNKFCSGNNIVAEFTRFHPLLENYKFSEDYLNVRYDRQTVFVDLTEKYDNIYKNYARSVRQKLNTAATNNLSVFVYENTFPHKKEFIEMYKETMNKVNAASYLYFNEDYFLNTFNIPNLTQFVVFKDQLPVASSLCLGVDYYLHAHFIASKSDFLSVRPNDFLFDAMIKYGIQKGFKELHFGGGRTSSAGDSLLRFKKHFSNSTSDFFIGKKIYNQTIYNKVCEQWKADYPHLVFKYKDRLLAYRYFD